MRGEGKGSKRLNYAAYGSNLHPARLIARTPSAHLLGTTHLHDWSLSFHKRSKDESGKCTIQRGVSGVHFAVYAMSADDKILLDEIEGLGNGYDGIELDTPEVGRCFSYIAQRDFIDDTLQPYTWYRALVLAGAKFHGFPDDYVRRLEATSAIRDPDLKRDAEHWRIVDKVITTHC